MKDHLGSAAWDQRSSAARWWLVFAVVLAVVVVGASVGLRASLVETSPKPAPATPLKAPTSQSVAPSPSPSLADPGAPVVVETGQGQLLPGIGAGQVYAQAATGIFRIELSTGRITRTATVDLEEHATFLAGPDWVLVKSRWSPTGVLVRDGKPAAPLPRQFDAEGLLHLGPRGHLWVQPELSTDSKSSVILRLAQLDGRPVLGQTVTVRQAAAPYEIVADGYGGLLMVSGGGVYRLDPVRPRHASQSQRIARGDLVAVGGYRLLVWECPSRARCQLVLVDQRNGHRTTRPAAARVLLARGGIGMDRNNYGDNLLSPDGTNLAVMAQDSTGEFRVHVIDLGSGRDTVLPGIGPDSNVNRQLAWSSNSRWLLALTDHQLRGYDTRTQAIRSIPLGSEQLLHLTTVKAAGW